MAVVIVKPALAATAKVFNQRAVGSGFPQKVLAKPQAGQNARTGTLSLFPSGYRPPGHTGRAGCLRNQESGNRSFPAQGADHARQFVGKD